MEYWEFVKKRFLVWPFVLKNNIINVIIRRSQIKSELQIRRKSDLNLLYFPRLETGLKTTLRLFTYTPGHFFNLTDLSPCKGCQDKKSLLSDKSTHCIFNYRVKFCYQYNKSTIRYLLFYSFLTHLK